MNIYEDMQLAMLRDMQQTSGQGTIRYVKPGDPTGPAYDPQPGAPTYHPVNGLVSGVAQEYVDGSYVLATDEAAQLCALDVEPSNDGRLEVDGVEREIVKVERLPSAGTLVGWYVIIRS